MSIPRAVRNNNPGNLEAGARWKGLMASSLMSAAQKRERRFAVFRSPLWGFRALALLLRNGQRRHGLHTIREIVARFAPPNENDTQAYIRAVSHAMNMAPDARLDLDHPHTLVALCKAVAVHESGGWFFSQADLAKGVALALPPPVA